VTESGWTGAEVTGSVVAGVEAFAARLRRVSLRGCKLDSVNFGDAVTTAQLMDLAPLLAERMGPTVADG
jgi:hypothetical protein